MVGTAETAETFPALLCCFGTGVKCCLDKGLSEKELTEKGEPQIDADELQQICRQSGNMKDDQGESKTKLD